MLKELIGRRYRANGRESFSLTDVQSRARDEISAGLQSGRLKTVGVSCPLCGVRSERCLAEKDTYGIPVRVVICKDCGLVYNSPRLSDQSLKVFYAEMFRGLDRALPSHTAYFELEVTKGQRIFSFLESHSLLGGLDGKLIVDIGCGAGGVLKFFNQMGYAVAGCDLVQENVDFGRRNHGLNLHYGDLDDLLKVLGSERTPIGLVIYEQVFEHLPNPAEEIKKLTACLGPQTLLYVGVPGLRNIQNQYNSDFLRYLQLPHLVHFDLEHLRAMVESNGFEFIQGNEIAQAVFKRGSVANLCHNLSCDQVVFYLQNLEAQRRKRVITEAIRGFPHNLLPVVRNVVERAPLPNSIKTRLINGLRKMKRFLF